jgi:hypothetical protein
MMEDHNREMEEAKPAKAALAAKLGLLAALFPNPSLSYFNKSDEAVTEPFDIGSPGLNLTK